jgi:hypothetical protein
LPAYGEFLTAPFTYFAADSRFNPDIDWAMAEKLPAGFRDQSNFDWKNPLINDARASFGELLPSDADDVAPIGLF